ncbi:PIG-L deacetylase family protein [Rhodobacter sp. NSM]|uniref:PIG-L deacetylase family protein n=1 Tax=Rhodobacter sp. NSM TaxID=3457501 RepID=UPI003FD0F7D9
MRNWRHASFADLSGGRPIVVLAPHPDDEALGCGALLAAAFQGPGARVVCMTDGAASHPNSRLWPRDRLAALRASELDLSIRELGGAPDIVTRLNLPDAAMPGPGPAREAALQQVEAVIRACKAGALFATSPTDPHCDHIATAAIAREAAARTGVRLFFYPIWSRWSDPDYRRRMGSVIEHRFDARRGASAKGRAIAAHRSQLGLVIGDDPEGFVLPEAFLADFRTGDEIFFEEAL